MRPQQVKEALSQIELVIKGNSTTFKNSKASEDSFMQYYILNVFLKDTITY